MIPPIRLNTASGYFLQWQTLRQYIAVTTIPPISYLAFSRSNRSVARPLSPAPSSARTITSQVDGSR